MKKKVKPATILSTNHFPVIGVGASAGGLDAFKKLLKAIPEDAGMAYVLVQHLDPNHESLLPELLQKVTNIPVLEISDDIIVKPDHIYVLPSNKMMIANDGVLQLTSRESKNKNERNLPIDLFFTSLAEVHQGHAIGVVLSGTASDGTIGLKAIKDHGGITFAQDEDSANYKSMPHSAIQAGVVDFILPPEKIPEKIIELNRQISTHYQATDADSSIDYYRQIIALLRIRKGTDFTYYKKSTIQRRILRRMALSKNTELISYLKYLRENKGELDILFQDLLIPVTAFFRDPKSFDTLCNEVLPAILKNKTSADPIRIWIAGCSSGEEAYSIAICLSECLEERLNKVQIFATDINENSIAKARLGIYSKQEIEKLTPHQIKNYFIKKEGHYQISKVIRDNFIFAVHNFLKDPPFGKIDLISCRNVFIYMEPYLQKKALATFHYALNPKGLLFLGKSEAISGLTDLFTSAGKKDKLFVRKDLPGKFVHTMSKRGEVDFPRPFVPIKNETLRTDFQKAADDLILNKYTPVGVVVNEALDIVYFRGNTASYLEQGSGKPSHQVLKMARQGLAFELRSLLHKAKKGKKSITKNDISFKVNGLINFISIDVIPLPNIVEPHYLILFHDSKLVGKTKQAISKSIKRSKDQRDVFIEKLGHELAQTHEDMRSITEEQEAANEELQSANEELLSSSEESQSLNEELETSKEELQSTNEELITVNQELVNLNEHLHEAKEYAEAIIATIREPLLVLDKSLRVKTANQSYFTSFKTTEKEVQGKLIYELANNQWDIPALRKLLETILPEEFAFNNFEIAQTFSGMGERVMLLNGREITKSQGSEKLILLAIEDITERKNHERQIQELLYRFQNLVAKAPISICIIRKQNYVIELANDAYLEMIGRGKEFINKPFFDSLPELKTQGIKELLDKVMETGAPFYANEREVNLLKNDIDERRFFSFYYKPLQDHDGTITGVIAVAYEVTEQVELKNKNQQNHINRERELEEKVALRTAELQEINNLLVKQNEEKERRSSELAIANKELELQNAEKEKRKMDLIAANQELESFTYIASHDLQEPLRKIQTFAKLIAEREVEKLSDTGKDYFKRMARSAKHMQILIDDLLAYSRANTKAQEFENTNMNAIVGEVISDFKETIEEKQATIEYNDLGMANLIPFQFRQLTQNLIGNSLKFANTERRPHIKLTSRVAMGSELHSTNQSLTVEMLELEKTYHHISISDNGIGFEPKFKDKIFEVFQRLQGKSQYAGTGIGLAIVKKIVENHKGIITATSELDKGVTFDIYIPK